MKAYQEFIQRKVATVDHFGLEVDPSEINPKLKPFTRDIVQWAVRGGRRAIFARFGLHKTATQIEIMRLIGAKEPCLRLIVLPLNVRQEFRRDAENLFNGDYAVTVKFIREASEIEDERTIYLTNYESVREGKLDPSLFNATSLDEAAVLRSFGSKTFGEFLFGPAMKVKYKFAATATPDPNEYLELIAYAHYLGIMDMGEAKTRFFKRNSEKADKLTLHPHKEEEFWMWVASWSVFLQRPSDLGYSDEGYELPPLDVRWHEIPTDHSNAGIERGGQQRLVKDLSMGVSEAAKEKRDSLPARIAKLMALRAEGPEAHRIIWHDLEDERRAIEKAVPSVVSIYGSQDLEAREQSVIDFSDGKIQELAAKPVMLGAGCNLQRHCAWSIFLGVGHKFNDFIQAIHRLYRFMQSKQVRIDLIYTEAERPVRENLERKWARHLKQAEKMTEIIRKYGLSHESLAAGLTRSLTVERKEATGDGWKLINNDSVIETARMESDSVGLIHSSFPFSTQYEYTPSYYDFGHNQDDDTFLEQMDFLVPELHRILMPGRVAAIHLKDRVQDGGMTGLGFQTINPFHMKVTFQFIKHGFAYIGKKTIVTDVVRENNQTYRLGWTEQCKDGSRMGCGLPEYLLLFRKPPTDSSNGYADLPVVKDKDKFTLGRWQIDAHGFMRSSGNRLLSPEDLDGKTWKQIYQAYKKHSIESVYDFNHHISLCDRLREQKKLPIDFMLLPPQSWHPDVWTDITRMRTLNGAQSAKGKEKHVCPLQFDIVERTIVQYSNEGEVVFDPFSGLGTVPMMAVKLGRIGWGCELSPAYFQDSVYYLKEAEAARAVPGLFDLMEVEAATKPNEMN